jgi:thiol-disulfide isomerase/thioredoxin
MGSSRLTWFAIAAVAVLAAGAGLYVGSLRQSTDASMQATSALLGLTLPDPDGRDQPLAQWRGKLLVVNFWATWCAPCRAEMPEFVKAQSLYGPRGLQFVGVAVDEPGKTREFAKEIGLNYPVLIGGFGAMELSKSLGNAVMALPFTIVVNRQGEVAYTQLGTLKPQTLNMLIEKFL